MTWTKLSDDFGDECWTLSDAAFRLHVEMLNYSNRKLLDLRIPKEELRRFAKRPDAAAELVDGGWIEDLGNDYLIVFHGSHQPARVDVVKKREAAIQNGRKGGRPAKATREQAPQKTQQLSQQQTQRDGTGIRDEVVDATTYVSRPPATEEPNSNSYWVSEASKEIAPPPMNDWPEVEPGVWAEPDPASSDAWGNVPVAVPGQGKKPAVA